MPNERPPEPWNPQRHHRARRRRRRAVAIVVAGAIGLLAVGFWGLVRGGEGPSRASAPPERRAPQDPAPPSSERKTTDTTKSMFDSGVPATVSTLPALIPGSLEAYADGSHEFVSAVHAAANAKVTGVDLPSELAGDQARMLQDRLATLDHQASGVSGAEQITAANHAYAPLLGLLATGTGSPEQMVGILRAADEKWQAALNASNPNSQLQLPDVADVKQSTPRP